MRLNKKKFFIRMILPILLLAIIITAVAISSSMSGTYTMEWGSIESRTVNAVVVRNESLVNGTDYGRIEYSVLEGQKVAADEQIAWVYKKEYVQMVLDDLNKLENDIYKYQKEDLYKEIETPELIELDISINKAIEEMMEAIKTQDGDDFAALEKNLASVISDRREYLKNSLSSNSHLTNLYNDEQEYIDRLSDWKIAVKSKQAGFVSFNFDGLENVLNSKSLRTIDAESIETAIENQREKKVSESKSGVPLYRMVDGAKWWLVADIKSGTQLTQGSQIKVNIRGISGEFQATVNDVRKGNGGSIAILEMTGDITPFINVRSVELSLNGKIEGYKVPSRAVKTNGNTIGVYVNDGAKRFVPVKVLGKEDGYSIIESMDSTYKFSIHQSVLKR